MFASVWVKDYEIDLDGKPYTIKNERWLGLINENGEPYFNGMSFDWDEDKKEYSVCGAGDIVKSREEFMKAAEKVTYFK